MFGHVYAGRRVLVTGHTGFKGSWLTAWLLGLGAEVAGFSDGVPTSPAHFDVIGLADRIRDYRGDVRDRKALVAVMQEFQPEIVFHLAAQALVRASYEDPAATIEINAMGTLNILEAVRVTPSVQAVVSITSDKAYRNDEWVWGYRETDHLGGYDPYSASKGCAEIIAHSYFKSFFSGEGTPSCATTRAGNVIGGGDWAADLHRSGLRPGAWSAGKPVEIRSPYATRPGSMCLNLCPVISGWARSCSPRGKERRRDVPTAEMAASTASGWMGRRSTLGLPPMSAGPWGMWFVRLRGTGKVFPARWIWPVTPA